MFEKNQYQEAASTSVQTMPASTTKIVQSADDREPTLTEAKKSTVAPAVSPVNASIIGSDVTFKGELMAGNDIHIHGRIEGMIARHTKNVIIGKEGRVRALIHASSVKVLGQVDGDIHGDDLVELLEGAKVDGNIFCPCVKIEKGAQFNGTISMDWHETPPAV